MIPHCEAQRIQTSRCYHWKTQVPNKGIHHACPVSFRETLPPLLATHPRPSRSHASNLSKSLLLHLYPYLFYTSRRYMYVSASQLTLRYLDFLTYTLPSLFVMMMMMMMSGAALSDTASIMLCTVSTIRAIETLILSPAAHAYLCIGQRLDRPTDRPHCYHIQTLTCPSGTHAKRRP